MPAVSEELKLLVRAETKQAVQEMQKASGAVRGVNNATQEVGISSQNIASRIRAGWMAATMAITGTIMAVKGLLAQYSKQDQAERKLNAVLKSTKQAAGMTAEELKSIATNLQSVTKFGDEAIINAQSLLLTFTKIGRDVFPRANEVMLDMSETLGQSLQSSAIQLGKALNDPIQGVTALRRVGVQLTKQQEAQIKSFVQLGNISGAQKVILKELETQMGGVAKAAAKGSGAIQQTKNILSDYAEIIGKNMMPVINPFLKGLVAIGGAFTSLPKSISATVAAIAILTPAFIALNVALGPLGLALGGVGIAIIGLVAVVGKLSVEMAKGEKSFATFTKSIEDSVPIIGGYINQLLISIFGLIKAYENLNTVRNSALVKNNAEVIALRKDIDARKGLIKRLKEHKEAQDKLWGTGSTERRIKNQREEIKRLQAQISKLQGIGIPKKTKTNRPAVTGDEIEKAAKAEARLRIAIEKNAIAQIIAERDTLEINNKENADKAIALTKQEEERKTNIIRAQLKAELTNKKLSIKERKALHIEAATAINEIEENALKKNISYLKKADDAEKKLKEKRLADEKAFWDAVKMIAQTGIQNVTGLMTVLNNNRIAQLERLKSEIADRESEAADAQIAELEKQFDSEKNILQKKIDDELDAEREKNAELLEIEKEYLEEKQALEEDDLELKIERLRMEIAEKELQREYDLNADERKYLDLELREMEHQLRSLENQLFYEKNLEDQKAASDARIVTLETERNTTLTDLEKKKDDSVIKLNAEKDAAISAQQKKIDAEIKKINRDNFEISRAARISDVWMRVPTLIAGISAAIAPFMGPAAVAAPGIAAGIGLALGGTQTASIAAQENPYSFQAGGLITQDMTAVRLAEGNKREFVLNNRLTELFIGIANSLRSGNFGNNFNGPISVNANNGEEFVGSIDKFRARGGRFRERF